MRQQLVRMSSTDGIEMPGILYRPETDTNKLVIHVHGLNGNFYENRFIDSLAAAYTDRGYALLTFNNRGKDFIAELLKGDGITVIGGSLERFPDCLLDIEGAVKWGKEQGYQDIMLEGHSYGCNKVIYYYAHKKSPEIKQLVLLAPCDIPAECTKFLTPEEYELARADSTRLVEAGRETELIDFPVMANGKIAAGTYYHDFLPGGETDFIKYSDGENAKSAILTAIEIPVLVIFGDTDECVLTQPLNVVTKYLANNLKTCDIQIIAGADHSYTGKAKELGEVIRRSF